MRFYSNVQWVVAFETVQYLHVQSSAVTILAHSFVKITIASNSIFVTAQLLVKSELVFYHSWQVLVEEIVCLRNHFRETLCHCLLYFLSDGSLERTRFQPVVIAVLKVSNERYTRTTDNGLHGNGYGYTMRTTMYRPDRARVRDFA